MYFFLNWSHAVLDSAATTSQNVITTRHNCFSWSHIKCQNVPGEKFLWFGETYFFAWQIVMFASWVCSMQTFNGSNDHSRFEAPQAGPQFVMLCCCKNCPCTYCFYWIRIKRNSNSSSQTRLLYSEWQQTHDVFRSPLFLSVCQSAE